MKTATLWRLGALTMLIGALSAPTALGQVFLPDNSSWSITEPTDVGGTVLQPGTYRITVVPGAIDRNVVRITSPDGATHYTTVLTVPHPLRADEEVPSTTFVYYPPIEGEPRALRTWYPAEAPREIGYDFVYDEDRAAALARASESRVVYYRQDDEIDVDTELQVVTPEATIETYVVPDTILADARTLPATAGRTPLLALLGLLSVAGALAIRAANQ